MNKHFMAVALVLALGTTYGASQDRTAQSAPAAASAQAAADSDSKPQIDDKTLTTNIHQQFDTDAAFKNVQVAVVNGEVDLSGTVSSKDDRKRAKEMASAVPGVRSVRDRLTVAAANVSPAASVTGNTAMTETSNNSAGSIAGNSDATSASRTGQSTETGTPSNSGSSSSAQSAGTAGATTGQAGAGAVGGTTGSVTATGAATDKSGATSNTGSVGAPTAGAAAEAAEHSTSMQGQTGGIGTEASSTAALKAQLDSAFQSEPTLSSSHVMVNVTDTTIELTGTVPTGKERQTAKRIAQSYAGNRKVNDKLTVSGRGASSGNNPGMGQSGASNSTDMNTGVGTNTTTTGTTPTTKDPSSNPPASNNDTPKTKPDQTTESPR